MTDDRTEQLARTFHSIVRRALPDVLGEVDAENGRRDDGSCATHDHCDAHVLMDDAFRRVLGREFDCGSDADCRLRDTAWDRAETHGFNKEWMT